MRSGIKFILGQQVKNVEKIFIRLRMQVVKEEAEVVNPLKQVQIKLVLFQQKEIQNL